VNLPESKSGRWGQGLTAEKMKDCHWLKPVLVEEIAFVEWTPDQPADPSCHNDPGTLERSI